MTTTSRACTCGRTQRAYTWRRQRSGTRRWAYWWWARARQCTWWRARWWTRRRMICCREKCWMSTWSQRRWPRIILTLHPMGRFNSSSTPLSFLGLVGTWVLGFMSTLGLQRRIQQGHTSTCRTRSLHSTGSKSCQACHQACTWKWNPPTAYQHTQYSSSAGPSKLQFS